MSKASFPGVQRLPVRGNAETRAAAEAVSSWPPASRDASLPHEDSQGYLPGDIVADKYRLRKLLGEGGMGSVWVAQNVMLGTDVALKLIKGGQASSQGARRLLREAQTAAQLIHPAIVQVFDFGRAKRDAPFIVMELLTGESLGDLLARDGRLAATRAVQLLLPIADGLSTAHGKAVVHRDLKPDNIFLSKYGGERTQPKVVDFGIAKADTAESLKLTQTGAALGSPDYMSPEQARGATDVDHRTDIWSFCVVLYESLTGRLPFEEDNYNAQLQAIINKEPEPITSLSAGDRDLSEILQRGLSKPREDRWQSMKELGRALALWLYGHGVKEDVCGQSLRVTWLSDASALPDQESLIPRGSRQVLQDGAPPTFKRAASAVSTERLATPLQPTPAEQYAPARGGAARKSTLVTAAAVLAGAIVLAVLLFAGLRGSAPAEQEASPPLLQPATSPRSTAERVAPPAVEGVAPGPSAGALERNDAATPVDLAANDSEERRLAGLPGGKASAAPNKKQPPAASPRPPPSGKTAPHPALKPAPNQAVPPDYGF